MDIFNGFDTFCQIAFQKRYCMLFSHTRHVKVPFVSSELYIFSASINLMGDRWYLTVLK